MLNLRYERTKANKSIPEKMRSQGANDTISKALGNKKRTSIPEAIRNDNRYLS